MDCTDLDLRKYLIAIAKANAALPRITKGAFSLDRIIYHKLILL